MPLEKSKNFCVQNRTEKWLQVAQVEQKKMEMQNHMIRFEGNKSTLLCFMFST